MLQQLPDYVCTETVERSVRSEEAKPFRRLDTLQLLVGWVNGREYYSFPGGQGVDSNEIRQLVGRGLTSNGNFAGHVQHVILSETVEFTPGGNVLLQARKAVRYEYVAPQGSSRYRIRGTPSAEVGVYGTFWFDPRTLDLMRMEVHADDIPRSVGIAQLTEVVDYARRPIGNADVLLPASSELTVFMLTGDEFQNRATFGDCRQFRVESNLSFDHPPRVEDPLSPRNVDSGQDRVLPANIRVELVLDSDIDLTKAAPGERIRAVINRNISDGDRTIVAEGTIVHGSIVRIEAAEQPFPHYEIALAFESIRAGGAGYPFYATMQDAGPAPGLLREAKRLDPVFTRKRSARLDILVGQKSRGEGVLLWDARRPQIRRGLKMRWLTFDLKPQ